VARELRLFGVPTAICAFAAGDVAMHASAVEVGGHGVVLAGPSMYGKTTLAAAFAAAGHRLLTEDTTRISAGETPLVFPGPAAVRLRADVAGSIRLAGASPIPVDQGRTPLVFDASLRGDGAGVPLAAVIVLRRGDGSPRLEPIPTAEATRDLFALSFRLATPGSRADAFGRIVDLAARTEALNLYRSLTIEELPEVVGLVERHLGVG
jgi:hypothetical protein